MRSAAFWLRLGGWILLAGGPAHLVGHIAGKSRPPESPTEVELFRLVRQYKFHLSGLERSYENIHDGFSLSMAALSLLAGLLVLLAARHARSAPTLVHEMAIAGASGCAVLAILNLVYTIPPPAVLYALAALAFVACIVTARASAYRDVPGARGAGQPGREG